MPLATPRPGWVRWLIVSTIIELVVAGIYFGVTMGIGTRRARTASTGSGSPAPAANYLGAGAAGIPKALAPLVGNAPKILRASLFAEHAVVSVQTAKNAATSYIMRGAEASRFNDESLGGDEARNLDSYVFPLTEVKFEQIPAMVATAQKLGLDGPTLVVCDRGLPFGGKPGNFVVCRISGKGEDSFTFSPSGKALGGTLGGKAVGTDGKPSNYFVTPGLVRAGIAEHLGDKVRLASLVLYKEYAIFSAENPARKGDVDRYDLRPTGLGSPTPDTMNSSRPGLEKRSFTLDAIDWNALPGLVADARTRLKLDGAETSHVGIDKIFGNSLAIRVYLSSPYRSGFVEYDARGKFLRAN